MRLILYTTALCIVVLSFSCGSPENRIGSEAAAIAEDYVLKQLRDPRRQTLDNGSIVISDSVKAFILDPKNIFPGFIDNDDKPDAIVSINVFINRQSADAEHLIMINNEGGLMLIRSLESDMKILSVKDGIITAEIHTRPRTSPLYNCPSCKEVVKFRYSQGELIRTDI